MNFAVIQNDTVIAIIAMFPTNWMQFQEVVVAPLTVQVGDSYIMGHFYRDGELVLSPEELIVKEYEAAIADMQNALHLLGVTEE